MTFPAHTGVYRWATYADDSSRPSQDSSLRVLDCAPVTASCRAVTLVNPNPGTAIRILVSAPDPYREVLLVVPAGEQRTVPWLGTRAEVNAQAADFIAGWSAIVYSEATDTDQGLWGTEKVAVPQQC